jgi:ribosomal protein S18 acetylase RimI-like enzyme
MSALDNPVHAALTSRQCAIALAHGGARRYPFEYGRFAGLESPDAFPDLLALVEPRDTVAFFTSRPLDLPPEWELLRARPIEQMLATERPAPPRLDPVVLTAADVPEMLELAAVTEPGPFFARTLELGLYLGIRAAGALVAMAGERMMLDGYTEISAVCTAPAHQGRGYAKSLMAALMHKAFDEGRQPFLHVKHENGARLLYEGLGFRTSRFLQLTVVQRAVSPS